MTKYEKRCLCGAGVMVAGVAILCWFIHGCGQRAVNSSKAESTVISGVICPPDAKYCAAPPEGAFGRMVEPARGKALVFDAGGSDPRIIDMDIPAGTWLVKGGDK